MFSVGFYKEDNDNPIGNALIRVLYSTKMILKIILNKSLQHKVKPQSSDGILLVIRVI